MSNANDEPSGAVLAELMNLSKQRAGDKRSLNVWQAILKAEGLPEFPIVIDYALANGLIVGCATDARSGAENKTWLNPLDLSEMVPIPAGPFVIGRTNRPAQCGGFSLARFPVTNAQFKQFLDETAYQPEGESFVEGGFLAHWPHGKIPRGKEDHPVVWVSFIDALHYCRWAGLTLPTEWAWEKAARGVDGRFLPWGDLEYRMESKARQFQKLTNVVAASTCAVGKYPRTRTAYGCEDMVGNVSEWCQTTPWIPVVRKPEPTAKPAKRTKRAAPPAQDQRPLPDSGFFPEAGSVCVGRDQDRAQGRRTKEGETQTLQAATARDCPDFAHLTLSGFAVVRGSCYRRRDTARMPAWHRRRLSIFRRNSWVGFRPALLLPFRPA